MMHRSLSLTFFTIKTIAIIRKRYVDISLSLKYQGNLFLWYYGFCINTRFAHVKIKTLCKDKVSVSNWRFKTLIGFHPQFWRNTNGVKGQKLC